MAFLESKTHKLMFMQVRQMTTNHCWESSGELFAGRILELSMYSSQYPILFRTL